MYNRTIYKMNPFEYLPCLENEYFTMMYTIPGIISIKNNAYMISNYGRILSFINNSKSSIPEIIKTRSTDRGYMNVTLYTDDFGGRNIFSVHRLVAIFFLFRPDCRELMVNHKNGIHDDNRVENLEWVINRENQIHAMKVLGTVKRSLTEEQVNAIRFELKNNSSSYMVLANKYNTTYDIIRSIANKDHYNDIEYNDTAEQKIYEEAKSINSSIVLDIYYQSKQNIDDERLAELYNVSVSTVIAIRTVHPAYRHILSNMQPLRKEGIRKGKIKYKFDEETAIQIYNEKRNGSTVSSLAAKYKSDVGTINKIIKCRGNYSYLQYKYGLNPLYKEG